MGLLPGLLNLSFPVLLEHLLETLNPDVPRVSLHSVPIIVSDLTAHQYLLVPFRVSHGDCCVIQFLSMISWFLLLRYFPRYPNTLVIVLLLPPVKRVVKISKLTSYCQRLLAGEYQMEMPRIFKFDLCEDFRILQYSMVTYSI